MSETQTAAIEFLADPATHGVGAGDVKRIDTHGAVVFLAGDRVYKIKRSVKYPYLDFSTLDKREAALRAEIDVNRRFSPELYLDVIAVSRADGGKLALGGEGEAVEWVLVMRRFDENDTLDHVAERGELDDALARALGEAVADAHKKSPRFDGETWIEALGRFVADEDMAIHAAADLIAVADADDLGGALRSGLEKITPLLRERAGQGHIRHGHGDLHLRNVTRIDGKPVLFDALEFDPVVAAGDVLYDLAFLLMDLLARDLRGQANLVFNRYLIAASRDEHLDALAAMPFFLALRAAIRARVALDKRELVQGKEREEASGEAKQYVALAARLIAPAPPKLIAIGGLSGTGKSTIAAALAPYVEPAPGAVHLRSDIERKRLAGVGELDRLPPESYTPQSSARVYERINELAKRTIVSGHSAIADAVHAQPDERDEVGSVAKVAGVAFEGI
jgi:aminoglycoside phosphotransferase family enzyme